VIGDLAIFGISFVLAKRTGFARHILFVLFCVAISSSFAGLAAMTAVAFLICGSFLIGIAVWRTIDSDRPSFVLATAVGLAIFAICLNIAELFPINYPAVFTLVGLIPYGFLLIHGFRAIAFEVVAERIVALVKPRVSIDLICEMGAYVFIFVLQIHFLYVLLPERYFDARWCRTSTSHPWPLENFSDDRWGGRFNLGLLWNATFRSGEFLEARPGVIGIGFLLLLPVPALSRCKGIK
jgi:hypothetical protein